MITFHNDHLVSPVLCQILYHTIPENQHVPVVFHTRGRLMKDEKIYPIGCLTDMGGALRVEINLNGVFRSPSAIHGARSFQVWFTLLRVCYHEFGHLDDPYLQNLPAGAYASGGYEYDSAEKRAHAFANRMIARLADYDRRLCQPPWLGYLSIRMQKIFKNARTWNIESARQLWFPELRCAISGGQMTTGDVAENLGLPPLKRTACLYGNSIEDIGVANTKLIRKIASDLAFIYIDRRERKHRLFAYGDLREIARRVTARQICSNHSESVS